MSGFLYFFETTSQPLKAGLVNPDLLKKCGLVSVFRDSNELPEKCTQHKCAGPDGKEGYVLYPMPEHREAPPYGTYHPESQVWIDRGTFWIGVEKGNEPEPRDLERAVSYPGFVLNDRRDNEWSIPIIRMPDGNGSLPVEYTFDREGTMINRICPEFKDVWELSGEALDVLQSILSEESQETKKKWSEEYQIKMALTFLAINYRVSMHEVAMLFEAEKGILDTEIAINILMAVTNWPVWLEHKASQQQTPNEKKKGRQVAA